MDIEQFKLFLKNNFIIINYPTGCFGGFLATTLCIAEENSLLKDNLNKKEKPLFTDNGSSHQNIVECFNNFHNYDHLNEWVKLNNSERLNYLYENCLVKETDGEKFFIMLICCPSYSNELNEFFNEQKIVTIKPEPNQYKLLTELIFYKGSNNFENSKIFTKFKINNFEKNIDKIKRISAEKSSKFFIETIDYNQKYLYSFVSLFEEETFLETLKKIETQLDLKLNYSIASKLYKDFMKLNKHYFKLCNLEIV